MNLNGLNAELLVQGPSTVDMEVITNPYENLETSSKCCNEHRRRRRHTLPSRFKNILIQDHQAKRLHVAAAVNNTEAIERILTNYDVRPDAADAQGRTALHIAASRGYVDAVTCLIKAGANVNAEDTLGNTPMHLAVYTSSAATVCSLIRGGAHLRSTKDLRYTPLQLAESKHTMLTKHKSVLNLTKSTPEIVKILRIMGDANSVKLQELDELANKVSQMGFEPSGHDIGATSG